MHTRQSLPPHTTLIPIAAGKGGVGKTFLTANLAIALAECGYRTVAVDLDLGGSNLHSFLGVPNRFPGVGDFLKARNAELHDLLVPTAIPNLSFIPGDGKTPFMANIPYTQKLRLISRIRTLPADYILLDLGAGSSYNTLDFFGLAPRGILLTAPELPAVMGMLVFLKNYLLRAIERRMAGNYAILTLLRDMYKQPIQDQTTLDALQHRLSLQDPQAGAMVAEIYANCRPRVVFNRGEHPDEMNLTYQISKSLADVLCLEADYFGFIFNDLAVRKSVQERQAFLPNFRDSIAAHSIVRIAQRIAKYWNRPIKDSAALVSKHVCQLYETLRQPSVAA